MIFISFNVYEWKFISWEYVADVNGHNTKKDELLNHTSVSSGYVMVW